MERVAIQRFQLQSQLGTGGMGTVYRAYDPQLERAVAIKVLSGADAGVRDELSTVRTVDLRAKAAPSTSSLLTEARMMARLSHPNVVQVYEIGLDDEDVFVVMELVDGENLRHWLATPRTPVEIRGVLAQAARGVAAAHAHAIIHRDLKPDNILIGRDGRVRVADFGLSRVTNQGFIRVTDLGGTPKYMAPELWTGAAPTPAADIYALCVAITDALESAPPLVATGLDADPAKRPSAAALEAELAIRRPRARWLVLGTGAAAIATGTIAFATMRGPAPCTDDPSLFATRWNGSLREAVAKKIDAKPDEIARVLARVDARVGSIARDHRKVCEAEHRDELTSAQAATRRACFERRAIEIQAAAHQLIDAKKQFTTAKVDEKLASTTTPCDDMTLPPIRDVVAVEALYRRYWNSPGIEELVAIERDAAALGEGEIEARAAIRLGQMQRNIGQNDDAVVSLDRGYRRALAIKSATQQAFALLARSDTATEQGNPRAAKSYAELARELAERPGMTPRTRVSVYGSLGHAELVVGEHQAAVTDLRRALAIQAESGEHFPEGEIKTRIDLLEAILFQRTKQTSEEGLAFALETEARAREIAGESSDLYAGAATGVAKAYSFNDKPELALPYREKALAIRRATLAPDHPTVLYARAEVAHNLLDLHRIDEARRELTEVIAIADRKPGQLSSMWHWRIRLAEAMFYAGDHEDAIARFEVGLQELIAEQGTSAENTQIRRRVLAGFELAAGKLADAAKTIATLDDVYSKQVTDRAKEQRQRVRGELLARLQLLRGAAKAAESTAREALASMAELKVSDGFKQTTLVVLGRTLVAQRRFAAAKPIFEQAMTFADAPDAEASAELGLVYVDEGLRDHAGAVARARKVEAVLATYPNRPTERAEVAAFLAKRPSKKR